MIKEKFFGRRNLNLIWEFTVTDFKLSYKNSLLGYLWSFLNPLLVFGVLYFVFTIFVRFDLPDYQLYLLLGIVLWSFLAGATSGALEAVLTKGVLIQKVAFPRADIVVAAVLNSFFTLLLNLLVFFAFLLFKGLVPGSGLLVFVFLLAELFLLVSGLALLLAAAYVRFRDLSHIWQVLLQVGFWLTPIVYPLGLVPAKYLWVVKLNPMAQIILASRQALIYQGGDQTAWLSPFLAPSALALTFGLCLLVFLAGLLYFNRRSPYFAEEL